MSDARISEIKPWLRKRIDILDKSIGDTKNLTLKDSLLKLFTRCSDIESNVDDKYTKLKVC